MSDGLGDPNFQDHERIESNLGEVWQNIKLPHRLGRSVRQLAAELDYELPDEQFFQSDAGKPITAKSSANTPQSRPLTGHSLVGIQTNGSNRPFFCVHPVDGKVFCYTELARCLGTAQPFYGLQSPSLDGSGVLYTKIEEMAAHYLEEIRQVQPQSPYILGGWSMGGIVAFEMAQQLRRCGEQVALLVLIDSWVPYNRNQDYDETETVIDFAKYLGDVLGKELKISYKVIQPLELDEQLKYVLDQVKNIELMHFDQIRRFFQVFKANVLAVQNYAPSIYPSQITLFRAKSKLNRDDSTNRWGELAAGGIDIHTIPGNHHTIIKNPNVQTLAEQISAICTQKNHIFSKNRIFHHSNQSYF
jgi:thioesterase domain-containing protein